MNSLSTIAATSPATIVIFGASGDLTRRKIVPALHSLNCAGHLAPGTRVVGVGRTPLAEDAFRERLYEGVQEYARLKPHPKLCSLWAEMGSRFTYFQLDTEDPAEYARLAEHLSHPDFSASGNLLFYVATPPEATPTVIDALGSSGLSRAQASGEWRRVVLEKPFGQDLASAKSLDRLVRKSFAESNVFRIDHYLGKETVQNLLAFRFANAVFEPVWRQDYVDHVQITVAEEVLTERRGASYDRIGVLRDIIQNHVLQLLALVAMEPPSSASARSLRDEKVKVLQAIRPVLAADVVLGQYDGYLREEGVAAASLTPTFAALRLWIDNGRWRGVPFLLRSGKGMPKKTTEITLQFRDVPHALLPEESPSPNRLSIRIQPNEGIQLQFRVKAPGQGMLTRPADLRFDYADHFDAAVLPDAYERLILDALNGDESLFLRSDEIEACWSILEPALQNDGKPFPYDVGSWGPPESTRLLGKESRFWLTSCHRQKDRCD